MSLVFPNLPAPDILDASTYETIFDRKLADFMTNYPAYANVQEGDPIYALLQSSAADELNIRQRVNNAYRQTVIIFATGANLDHLAYNIGLTRRVKTEAVFDDDGILEEPEELEDDRSLKQRYILAWHALAVGSVGWYKTQALESTTDVKDAYPKNTADGEVTVSIQSEADGGGVPTSALLTEVRTYLNARDRRTLCDTLVVQGITLVDYTITAELTVETGLDSATVLAQVEDAAEQFTLDNEVINRDIPQSRFYAVLSPIGVTGVTLTAPTADVITTDEEVPHATSITITTT